MKTNVILTIIFQFFILHFAYTQNLKTDTTIAGENSIKGYKYLKSYKFDSALVCFKKASAIYKTYKVWENYFVSQNGYCEAKYRQSVKNADEVISLLDEIISDSNKKFGDNNRFTATSLRLTGNVYLMKFEFEKSLKYYEKALKMRKELFGEKDAEIGTIFNNIGLSYYYQGDYLTAMKYYEKALEIRKSVLGEKHIDVAQTYNNISIIYYQQGDNQKAIEIISKAINIRKELLGENHPDVTQSYNNLASYYNTSGKFNEALKIHIKTLSINKKLYGEKHSVIATTYSNMAAVFNNMYKYDSALVYNKKALQLRKELFGSEHPDIAYTYEGLGLTYEYMGDFDKAINFKMKALEIIKKVFGELHPDAATAYNNLGVIHSKKANYKIAIDFFSKALQIYQGNNHDENANVAMSLVNIGSIYGTTGQIDLAFDYIMKAISIYTKLSLNDSHEMALAYLHLADIYIGKTDYDLAIEMQQKAIEIQRKVFGENTIEVATSYQNLGKSYDMKKNYSKSLYYYEKALEIAKNMMGDYYSLTAACYESVGYIYLYQKMFDKAMDYFEKVLKIRINMLGNHHPDVALAYRNIANCFYDKSIFDKALEFTQKAISANVKNFKIEPIEKHLFDNPQLTNYYSATTLLDDLSKKVVILIQLYSKSNNINYLEKSLDVLNLCDKLSDYIIKNNIKQSDKLAFSQRKNNLSQLAVRVAYMLFIETKASKYIETGFGFLERAKTRTLIEAIAGADAQKFSGIPDSLIQQERTIKNNIAFYEKLIAEKPDSMNELFYRSKLFDEQQKLNSFLSVIESKFPNYFNLKYKIPDFNIKSLQSGLDYQTALISYWIDGKSIYAFVITNKDIKLWVNDANEEIEKLVEHVRAGILGGYAPNYIKTYYEASRKLFNWIFPSFISSEIKNLIIIPDAELASLPFEVLLTKDYSGAQKSFEEYPFLIKKYTIGYSYSAYLFYLLKNSQPNTKEKELLDWIALAPVFSDNQTSGITLRTRSILKKVSTSSNDTLRKRNEFYNGMSISPLPGTETEVTTIFNEFNSKKLKAKAEIKSNASEVFIKSGELNKYRYIHIATHGFVNSEYPELSGILLAQDTLSKEDGILYSGEIYNLELNADLVVLSACETGLGKVIKGEGVIGLSRALLYAGAKNIIVSLWQVSDESTMKLMIDFYKSLIDEDILKSSKYDKKIGLSLHEAKLKMIKSVKYAHPFFWSPFILIGK